MHTASPYNGFRLLVPATCVTTPDTLAIELEDTLWRITDDTLGIGNVPVYTCISYSWGTGQTANPIQPGQWMSDRVIPVLEATIRALHPAAMWIDAFCIPAQEPARTACLRSMGAVFASAFCVIAVLSKQCSAMLDAVARLGFLDEPGLLLLETDDWPSRAWTYQELVNSKSFYFVAEGGGVTLKGMQFLSKVTTALEDYKKAHGYDSYMLRTLHPRLDNLQDTIADWIMADYSKRCAYQTMSSMDRRTATRTDDYYYYALAGAISAEPVSSRYQTVLEQAEYFMQLCEEKGDFSFIYSIAPRCNVPGRTWRPEVGPIRAIQPWLTSGDGQTGSLEPGYLRLHNMCRMTRGTPTSPANLFITKWLPEGSGDIKSGKTPEHILMRIRQIGFVGCGDFLELEDGYFFPLSTYTSIDDVFVFTAAGLRWTHGGPGLIATQDVAGLFHFLDVGVFVGILPPSGESIDLA